MREPKYGLEIDELNLRLVESLLEDPNRPFKVLGKGLQVDQRTIAKRIRRMQELGVLKYMVDVDWPVLGLEAKAYVSTTTAQGERRVADLLKFIKSDPRIVEAYETLGSHQYFMEILEQDLPRLRESVLRDLEPLTADLSTSLVTSPIKKLDYLPLVRYLRESRFPRTRSK